MLVNVSRDGIDALRTQEGITTKVPGFFALERLGHGVAPYRPILFPQVRSIKA
jgi:hypothetical protein